jgi:hypothetical protein
MVSPVHCSQPAETTMTATIAPMNLSDVALVDAHNLWLAMQYMIDTERGLAMLRGVSEADLREIDRALWDTLASDPAERVAVLVRFRAMIKVFAARRLSNLLMHTGYRLLAPAVQVAARMRLNAQLGFNPVKFERALVQQLARLDLEPALAA